MTDTQKKKYTISIVSISLVYFILCTYRIYSIPFGYNVDEIGTAVDSYFLANYGVDRYNMKYPIYFVNYGGGQNALYQYLAAISYKIVGNNPIWIKLPGILVGVIGLIYIIKLFNRLFDNKTSLFAGVM